MKKFITILVLLLSLQSYTQSALDSIPNITETERIIDKYGSKISDGFNKMVEGVVPMAEAGFTMVVKLKFVEGIIMLLPLLFAIIFLILFKKEYNKLYNEIKDQTYSNVFDEDNITAFIIIYLILFGLFTSIAIFTTYTAITHIFIPEWFAIKEILNLI